MPYIKQEDRDRIDLKLDALLPEIMGAGQFNYVITSIMHDAIAYCGESYSLYNELIGALECAKLEVYRRLVGPYENEKIIENGDVMIYFRENMKRLDKILAEKNYV